MDKRIKNNTKINPNEFGALLYDRQELDAISDVLYGGKIFRYSGKETSPADRFENEVKEYLGVRYTLGLNNGTSALKAALRAVEIKPGSRVLISAYTFIATPAAVTSLGGIPIPIDLNLDSAMDMSELKVEINKGCSAIIPVHLQGRAFNIKPIIELARKKNIPVIEDACQAFGAKYGRTLAGCFGDIGVFSFQQYKQISSGEGGMLVTNKKDCYKRARIYSDHGVVREQKSWDVSDAMVGDNLRMNNLQAAILRTQLSKLPGIISSQKKNRDFILGEINNLKMSSILNSPDVKGETCMGILFITSSAKKATEAILHAKKRRIELRHLWNRPYYKNRVFDLNHLSPKYLRKSACKNAEDLSRRLISLSTPPVLSNKNLREMVKEIKSLYQLGLVN